MMHEKNKPQIRFSKFEDEWVQKKFSDVFDMLSNNTLSRDNLNYDYGIAYNVHYGDVLVKLGEYTDTEIEKLPFIADADLVSKFQSSLLKDGDVIIADTAEDEAVGKCTEIGNIKNKKVISGLHTIPCRPVEKFAPRFMGYYLNSPSYQDQTRPLMQGVKVLSISRSGIQDTELIVSANLLEQEMIGNYFASLDEKIRLEKIKCEKLKSIKTSMMKKMFPQDGATIPEIRFTGFTGEWKQGTISDFGEFYYGHSCPKWSVTPDANIPCIRYGELYTKFGAKIDKVYSYTSMPADKLRFSKGTEVLIPRVGEDPMDYVHCTWLSIPNVAIGEMISVYNTAQNPLFTAIMFNSTLRREFAIRVEGGSVTNLYYEKLKDIRVSFPEMEEQEKIAEFFSNIDNLVALQQIKIEKLVNIKAACMEKMFV